VISRVLGLVKYVASIEFVSYWNGKILISIIEIKIKKQKLELKNTLQQTDNQLIVSFIKNYKNYFSKKIGELI